MKQGEGIKSYFVTYNWFMDVSGMGLAGQARRLMHQDPPKSKQMLSDAVESWQGKLRRLEDHGDERKLAPVFKINALRSLMIGKQRSIMGYGKQGSLTSSGKERNSISMRP